MKKMKMILCALMSALMISVPIVGSVVTASAEDVDSLRSRLSELKEQEEEYRDILDQSDSKIADQQQYNDALVSKIETLSEKINLTRKEIAKLNESIAMNQKAINEGNANIEDQLNALCDRLRAIYMAGSASDLEIILGAKDFSDLIDKMNLVKNLSKYDKELIDKINDKLAVIQVNKDALMKDKEALAEDEEALNADLDDLNQTLEENKDRLMDLQIAQRDAQNMLNNLSDSKTELEDNIKKILEEQQREAHAEIQEQQQGDFESDDTPHSEPSSEPEYHPEPEPEYHPDPVPSGGSYVWPAPGVYYISSPYGDSEGRGYCHSGVDIAGPMGSTIVAADSGTVVATYSGCIHNWGKNGDCGCGGSYGNYVMIDHGNGKMTIYGHLSSVAVRTGSVVSKGDTIGYMGSTGHSTGSHLHFECRRNGSTYDPNSEIHYR